MKNATICTTHTYDNCLIIISVRPHYPTHKGQNYCVNIVDQSTGKVRSRMGTAYDDAPGGGSYVLDLRERLLLEAQSVITEYALSKARGKVARKRQ